MGLCHSPPVRPTNSEHFVPAEILAHSEHPLFQCQTRPAQMLDASALRRVQGSIATVKFNCALAA